MADAPATRQAFADLLATLADVADRYVHGDETFADIDVVEGYRFLLHLLSGAVEHRLEADPDRPLFKAIIAPDRKFLGDNSDARYCWARIRDDRAYRIRGRMVGEVYLSFTVHGPDPAGGAQQAVLVDVNVDDLVTAPDGTYEILLVPAEGDPAADDPNSHAATDDPAGDHPAADANRIVVPAGAESIITRHYFSGEVSVNADPTVDIPLVIEPLEDPGPPPPWSDDLLAERLAAVARFVRAETLDRPKPDEIGPITFVSREPNVLPAPASFRDSGLDTVGAVDLFYAMGPFVLGPDEALVMEGTLPPCRFANVMLWNRHMQTLEYRHRSTSRNDRQLHLGPDGSYRVVVAASDPGVPDWLDTEGRSIGTIFWRFVLPETDPPRPTCTVMALAEMQL